MSEKLKEFGNLLEFPTDKGYVNYLKRLLQLSPGVDPDVVILWANKGFPELMPHVRKFYRMLDSENKVTKAGNIKPSRPDRLPKMLIKRGPDSTFHKSFPSFRINNRRSNSTRPVCLMNYKTPVPRPIDVIRQCEYERLRKRRRDKRSEHMLNLRGLSTCDNPLYENASFLPRDYHRGTRKLLMKQNHSQVHLGSIGSNIGSICRSSDIYPSRSMINNGGPIDSSSAEGTLTALKNKQNKVPRCERFDIKKHLEQLKESNKGNGAISNENDGDSGILDKADEMCNFLTYATMLSECFQHLNKVQAFKIASRTWSKLSQKERDLF